MISGASYLCMPCHSEMRSRQCFTAVRLRMRAGQRRRAQHSVRVAGARGRRRLGALARARACLGVPAQPGAPQVCAAHHPHHGLCALRAPAGPRLCRRRGALAAAGSPAHAMLECCCGYVAPAIMHFDRDSFELGDRMGTAAVAHERLRHFPSPCIQQDQAEGMEHMPCSQDSSPQSGLRGP